jgi:ribose/xylose/arabinose/galactoside ABC-type transport system permease subunit
MIAADAFWIVFRFIHIVSAILWAGSAFAVFTFVEPTVSAMGPDGGRFMGYMVEKRKMPIVITSLSGLTVLGGIVLYLRASDGFDTDWISSGPGLGFTIGALAGIAAFLIGLTLIRPTVQRLQAIGAEVGASGGAPTPEQGAEMGRLLERMKSLGRTDFVLILIAATTMATARYWG